MSLGKRHEQRCPGLPNRKSELEKAISVLDDAQHTLADLSSAVLLDIKNFGMLRMDEVERMSVGTRMRS